MPLPGIETLFLG